MYNRASVTRQCLNGLLSRPLAADAEIAEIIVVDDGSRDLTPRLLAGYGDRIRVVTHAANAGFALSCNDGAAIASGEYLVFLKNDTVPRAGWLDALVRYAEAHPRAAVVGSKLLFPDDTIQHAGVVVCQDRFTRGIYTGFPADHPAVNKSRRFQAVTGACMLVRRAAFEEVGGFDGAFRNAYEDHDLCLRLGERGYEIHYCHESVVYRLEALSRGESAMSADPLRDTKHAIQLFQQRWDGRIRCDEVDYYLEDGLMTLSSRFPYPLRMWVSPLLAVLEGDGGEQLCARLLDRRARQVYDLQQANSRLEARLRDLELHVLADRQESTSAQRLTWTSLRTGATMFEVRDFVAGLFLQGEGIEIGALHEPVNVDSSVTVRYVDRMTVAELRQQYPELGKYKLVEPDIIDDGERLERIGDATQNFVIANHFIEHCQDPIRATATIFRVLKPGGIALLAIPDKRFTFDHKRPITPLDHLIRDHESGPEWSRREHYEEWLALVEDEVTRGKSARELMETDYSIHFHVWTQAELLEFFGALTKKYDLHFSIELMLMNDIEVLFVLRKDA